MHPPRDLANCSKLRMANLGWSEFKPHLRGSLGHGPSQHKRAVPRRGHGAKSLTQHRHACPSANSGSVDTVPEPSGCTPLSLSSCDHRQAGLSASGCECSLPEMAMKTWKKFHCHFMEGIVIGDWVYQPRVRGFVGLTSLRDSRRGKSRL